MPERVLVDRELVARMAVLVAREVVARTRRMAAVPGAGNCSNSAAAAAADIAGTNTDNTSQNDKHIRYYQACICGKINRGKESVMFGLKPYLRPSWKIALLFVAESEASYYSGLHVPSG